MGVGDESDPKRAPTGGAAGAISSLVARLASPPPCEAPPLLAPGTRVGRYEVLRVIGQGGFGVVYEAHDSALNRLVAVKAFHRTEAAPAAAGEGEAAARLAHPNIATVYDAGVLDRGFPFLVYEILHGETLESRLRRGPVPPGEALAIAADVARALVHAHAQGVVHRDLKPANVFLTADGAVKVLDFGVALLLGRAGEPGGTPAYMAPEQRREEAEDARTDLYALGVVLREMLTGDRDAPEAALADVHPAVRRVLAALLAEDPSARPRSARAGLAELEAASRATRGARARWSTRRRPGLWWLGAAGAVLGVSLAAWHLQRREPTFQNPLAEARFLQLTDFDGLEQAAAISRDGSLVAFQSDRDGRMDVWVSQVGSGRFVNLTRGGAADIVNPSVRTLGFSPDGTLVTYWVRGAEGTSGSGIGVWAAPVLGGQPRPYLEGVAELDWSSDGARLVYHTPGPGDPTYVRDAGQSTDAREIFTAPPGLHAHFPVWSPDQAYVYFVQGVPPDRMDLWRVRVAGGAPERLTHHEARVSHPVFLSPRTLLYLATDPEGLGPWIHGLDLDRRVSRRVSSGIDAYTSLAGSADGRRLVATVARPRRTLWRLPITGGRAEMAAARRVPQTSRNESSPRFGPGYLLYVASGASGDVLWKLQAGATTATELWSAPETRIVGAPAVRRDGGHIAFAMRQGGRTMLCVIDPDGTGARVVTSALALQGSPAWAPDGRSITIAAAVDGAPRLFEVPLDGRPPAPFVAGPSVDPAWSPGGDLVAYSGADVGTTFAVAAARADGEAHRLPALTLSRGARHLVFMPDGRTLVVLRGDLRHKNLWSIDLETGDEHQVTDLDPGFEVRDFDVSPDGREVVLEQVQEQADIALIELSR